MSNRPIKPYGLTSKSGEPFSVVCVLWGNYGGMATYSYPCECDLDRGMVHQESLVLNQDYFLYFKTATIRFCYYNERGNISGIDDIAIKLRVTERDYARKTTLVNAFLDVINQRPSCAKLNKMLAPLAIQSPRMTPGAFLRHMKDSTQAETP